MWWEVVGMAVVEEMMVGVGEHVVGVMMWEVVRKVLMSGEKEVWGLRCGVSGV